MSSLRMGRARVAALSSLLLACALAMPSVAWATTDENREQASDAEIAAALASGAIKTEDDSVDARSVDDEAAARSSSRISSPIAVKSFSGATMFETAVAEAKAAYPSSDTVILAGPGDSWVDALAGAGLAGALDCPILFAERTSLHPATKAALQQMGVKNAVVLGGTAAVSDGVVEELKGMGIALKARLGGDDCYDTQMKIYNYGLDNGLWASNMVIVATGGHYGDALSASPVAFAKKAPIFLVDSATKDLSEVQRDSLKKAAESGYGATVVIAGGTEAVSAEAAGTADFVSSLAGGSGESARLGGDTQYETSSAIASWAVSNAGFTWDKTAFTTGDAPYDALAGSVLQGKAKSAMLLVSPANASAISVAAAGKAHVSSLRIFGGKNAVEPSVRMRVAEAFGIPAASLPGFKVYVDAGHGKNDTGNGKYATGAVSGGYVEAELTADLADMVGNILKSDYGVSVYVNDDGGPYKYRHAEAKALGCDAIVSLHFNAGGGTGTESLIHNYNASFMSSFWQSQIHPYLIKGVGLTDRGKKDDEIAILGGSLPATLLEVCFIDNESDMRQYQSRKVEIAHEIAEGIVL
ncbi:cell wall-binding repeat-containing protein [Eggerthella lenta]|nr:cell wall-binding repeat-containing protein [Eggerthella lenta]